MIHSKFMSLSCSAEISPVQAPQPNFEQFCAATWTFGFFFVYWTVKRCRKMGATTTSESWGMGTNAVGVEHQLVHDALDDVLGLDQSVVGFPVASEECFSVLHLFLIFQIQIGIGDMDLNLWIFNLLLVEHGYNNQPMIPTSPEQQTKQFQILKVNRYEVEQNAIFLDYKIETLLSEIENFGEMKFHLRLSLAKNLKTIQDVLKDNRDSFYTLLDKMSKDHEELQIQMLQYFTQKLKTKPLPQHHQKALLIPLKNLANGPFLEVKQQSCKLISELAHSLAVEEIEQIIEFAHTLAKSQNEENKIVAIQLLARLARDLPVGKREAIFQVEFIGIYTGASVRVKKEVILELGKLAETVSSDFVDNKIVKGFYLKETKDNAWGIRKACVQILTELIPQVRITKQQLCTVLLTLLKDGNKFVRIASHKIVPQFTAKYGNKNIPKSVFDVYLSLIDLDINNQVSKQNQIIERVAFYFPGVLQTVGAGKWVVMRGLFDRLLHNRSQEVKRPLADSLHVISEIIGPQNSKEYLFSSLDYILREQMDSIKLCAIRNLSKFVAQFETQTRQNLIDVFLVLQKDPKKWRVRFLISNQLRFLSQIYDAQTNFKYLFPISLKLCNDQVSQVRKAATQQIIYVVNQLKPQEHLYKMALQSLVGYAVSQKYLQRQTFCLMLEALYKNSTTFFEDYSEYLNKLSEDTVPIVRIALAVAIRNIVQTEKDKEKRKGVYGRFRGWVDKLVEDVEVGEYLEELRDELGKETEKETDKDKEQESQKKGEMGVGS